jgi:hypothetical protein
MKINTRSLADRKTVGTNPLFFGVCGRQRRGQLVIDRGQEIGVGNFTSIWGTNGHCDGDRQQLKSAEWSSRSITRREFRVLEETGGATSLRVTE